jgi:predicted hydrocarbon binding protein
MNTCTPTADLMLWERVGPSLPAFRIRTRTRKYTSRETVRVSDCFECAGEGADGRTGCNFFRGHLAGLFAAAMGGGKVNVTETKCTSKGDPACEYSAEASP